MRQRGFERRQVVELDDARELASGRSPARAAPGGSRPTVHQPHEGFVDRAVVAAVEDQDLRSPGDGAGDAQREAVGVGGRRRDLPVRQAEAFGQQAPDLERVLVGSM